MSMNEVVEVRCRSREASKQAATSIHTATPIAEVADESPTHWKAR